MRLFFKEVFEIFTSNLVISNNICINAIFIGIIGYIAYKLAYYIVGELEFENIIGSLFHWSIRFIIFLTLSIIVNFIFDIINLFIALQSIYKVLISLVLIVISIFIFIKIKKVDYY